MNRERAKELLPIIQAFADGKDIEFNDHNGNWRNVTSPEWTENEYRIKPEKKVGYLNIYNTAGTCGLIFSTNCGAQMASTSSPVARIRIEYTEGQFDD